VALMGMQTTIKGAFTSAAMLTAINAAFTTAGIETIPTSDGILTNRGQEVTGWPFLFVTGPVWEQEGPASGTYRTLTGTMTLQLGICAPAEDTIAANAPLYGDALRAAVETTAKATPIMFCECVAGSADGEPVAIESGLPARLIEQRYRVVACYDHGQA